MPPPLQIPLQGTRLAGMMEKGPVQGRSMDLPFPRHFRIEVSVPARFPHLFLGAEQITSRMREQSGAGLTIPS